jgi:hypothetical protein
MARRQRGWLKQEMRVEGETWVLFFRRVRKSDGKRVEHKVPVGLVKDFPNKTSAWAEVEKLHLHLNQVDSVGKITFADLAHHYAEHELVEPTESIPKVRPPSEVFVSPPTKIPSKKTTRGGRRIPFDAAGQSDENAKLGRKGEEWVLKFEKKRLQMAQRAD